MAEHDKKLFEHELEEKFRKLDESIKIPEIPDAQSIFEKAENEKKNVVPFKKYSRYIAAAAAVVLICVSIPLISPALNAETAPQEPESAKYYATDEAVEEEICEAVVEEPETVYNDVAEASPELTDGKISNSKIDVEDGTDTQKRQNQTISVVNIKKILEAFFDENDVELNPQIGSNDVFRAYTIEETINKKREINFTVEEDYVSVILFDISSGDEVICAFWLEGVYRESFIEEEKYFISTYVKLSGDMVRAGDYLPMFGDSENGSGFINESAIIVPEIVEKGAMIVTAEINIVTGEYQIFANLV